MLCRESSQILVRLWRRVGFSSAAPMLCVERRLPPRKSGENGGAHTPHIPRGKIGKLTLLMSCHSLGAHFLLRTPRSLHVLPPCCVATKYSPPVLCVYPPVPQLRPPFAKRDFWQCARVLAIRVPVPLCMRAQRAVGGPLCTHHGLVVVWGVPSSLHSPGRGPHTRPRLTHLVRAYNTPEA